MKRFTYRQRDDAFGQSILALRTSLGLTQGELAQRLGVSGRAVRQWEGGLSYPKAEHLQHLMTLAVRASAFPPGREAEEIRALWKAARQKVLLDEQWLSTLLGRSRPSASVPAQPAVAVREALGPRVDWGEALDVPSFYGREQEVAQLSPLEQSVLCWLAIVREQVRLEELRALLVAPLAHVQVLEAVDGLRRRCLIERGQRAGSFTLQSVVLEFVTTKLVTTASQEIQQGRLERLLQHSLSQAGPRSTCGRPRSGCCWHPCLRAYRAWDIRELRWRDSCGEDGAITIWDLERGEHLRTLRRYRPYERLEITGIQGLTEAQKATFRALGAVENRS